MHNVQCRNEYSIQTWHEPVPWIDQREDRQEGRADYTRANPPTLERRIAIADLRQSRGATMNRCRQSPASTRMRTWRCRYPSSACYGTSTGDDHRPSWAASGERATDGVESRWRRQETTRRTLWLELGRTARLVVWSIVLFRAPFRLLSYAKAFRDFYRAMHFSAKRGIAIACRLSVCLWRWWIVIT